ncbi:MAG: hypothetical protein IJK02_00080 [Clostridia bacterium]|nr:hypothetical protein [Clostridia bacterium]
MLYKKNAAPTLSDALFKKPTSEYRGTPFWAWNYALTGEELCRQIDVFKEMGLGGFHMHVRTGLRDKYLSEDFFKLIRTCVDKAEKEEMLAWLYDEDRWPSGAAGGIVTKDERYRARCLLFTNRREAAAHTSSDSRSEGGRSGSGKVLACYDVELDADGFLTGYRRIGEDDEAAGQKWYAMLEIHQPSSWYNNQTYADTLNKAAIERFIEVTHEGYKKHVGDQFDKVVPAIFTDEPQFTRKRLLTTSVITDPIDVTVPWTDKVPELYKEAYGTDILDTLPEIFWELPDGAVSVHRYRYHDFIAELFAASFADTIGAWCDKNGIALTGHMMEEPTLHSQTAALGEAMRSYRGFGLPGIDLLCNNHEFTTAKQAQSAVHQFGREGMLSELYGVTGWDADFRLYKHQGDWQAALGVTVRVPHLSWYAMAGEAKRDYPASISYQSSWYKEFSRVEDHFARVNTALTRGKPYVKVGVIHPIESFWLHWGPNDKTGDVREELNRRFWDLTNLLLTGGVDFDFISESLLPSLNEAGGAPLKVGEMAYDTVIVPGCETLRATTVERLEAFRAAGGKLIFLGEAPKYCDAQPDGRGKALWEKSIRSDFSKVALMGLLRQEQELKVQTLNGAPCYEYLYARRRDTDGDWMFIAHAGEPGNKRLNARRHVILTVKGECRPVVYDTATGESYPIGADLVNGDTVIKTVLYGYDSLLLKLLPGTPDMPAAFPEVREGEGTHVLRPESFRLQEKNVLVLDRAAFRVDDGDWHGEEEMLRLDNVCRSILGLPERGGGVVQPWARDPETISHTVTVRFRFMSEIEVPDALLALEDADKANIVFNGENVPNTVIGNYVDTAIFTVKLPTIQKGENELTVTYPFGNTTDLENLFILGDFGVKAAGMHAAITAMPETLEFGDVCPQGFPFYGGPVDYTFKAAAKDGKLTVAATDYFGALIKVAVDGKEAGAIIYPPFSCTVTGLADGEHTVTLTVYLSRYNTFGPIHLVNELESWHGPGAWRTEEDNWSDQYVLRRGGIMKSPEIF